MDCNLGNIITVDFPGVTGVKRFPAVVLSSNEYHATRPDIIVGLNYLSNRTIGHYRLCASRLASRRIEGAICFP